MSPISINVDEHIIADGDYLVRVATAEEKKSKSSGLDMIELTYGFVGGSHAGQLVPGWDYLSFSPKAFQRTANALKNAFGVSVPETGTFTIDASQLVDRKLIVTLKTVHQEAQNGYDARDEQRVVGYAPAPSSAADSAVDAALAGVTPSATTLGADDIPF